MDLRTSVLLAGMMTKPEIIPPEPYEKVDYIEGFGQQYIDTGISAPNGFRFEVCLNVLDGQGRDTIVGSHNVSSPYERNFISLNKISLMLEFGLGNNFPDISAPPINSFFVLSGNTYNDGRNNILTLNDTTIYNSSSYSNGSRSANNLLLFTNQYYIANPYGSFLIAKMKYCKIWDNNDNLVRDMVAVHNNISNQYGMYDNISGQFFGNSGSGDFGGGND